MAPSNIRLLVVADFGFASDGPVTVSEENLSSMMQRLGPSLDLDVRDHLQPGSRKNLQCTLTFPSADAFHPAAIARTGPDMAELLAAREHLSRTDESTRKNSQESVDEPVDFSALPAGFLASDLGQRLQQTASSEEDRIGALLASTSDSSAQNIQGIIDEIDRRLSRQIVAISSEVQFSQLEAAWGGLAFLLRRLGSQDPKGSSVEVEILSATKEEFLNIFFDQAFHREYEGEPAVPLTAVILDYAFDRGLPDLEMLRQAGRMGESLRVPFIANLNAGFWGLKRLPLLAGLPDLEGRLQGPEYAKWNRLRGEEVSLWLNLVVNRFLLRDAWRVEGVPEFSWSGAESKDLPLWANGGWALAAALGQAFHRDGLQLPLTGVELADLPTKTHGGGRTEPFSHPLEVVLPDSRVLELGHGGLTALVARKEEDRGRFPMAPTFHRPTRYQKEEATRASFFAATLPHQVFAALVSNQLQRVSQDLDLGLSDEQIQNTFRQKLLDFLGEEDLERDPLGDESATLPETGALQTMEETTSDAAGSQVPPPPVVIEVETPADRPETRVITARVRPTYQICGGEADLVLGSAVLVG